MVYSIYALPTQTPTTGATAITFVSETYNVQPGDVVLVHTVAGGLGLLFAQLIKARGGTVIGTTSTPEKAALAKAHGADYVILYKSEDVAARVMEITKGAGVNAIYDGVGKDTYVHRPKITQRTRSVADEPHLGLRWTSGS